MSLTSTYFIVFFILLLVLYYLLPKKVQWVVLLVFSIVFYCFGGIKSIIYVGITSLSTYGTAYIIQRRKDKQKEYFSTNKDIITREEKKAYKSKIKSKNKVIMIWCIILNVVILSFFKFFLVAIQGINSIITNLFSGSALSIIIPLGISYYTLQAIGYLVDVYWGNVNAEKNYFKVLLFVLFFPQITQGPISDYKQLSSELFEEHNLDYKNISFGFQRMVWGFFKKLVIADFLVSNISLVFDNATNYSGFTVLVAAVLCIIQLYMDFSGYMDIVCGLCEMLGITLTENFKRPFFSKSVSEFWRRWHISLGAWFRKYVYYPAGMSKWNNKIATKTKKIIGEKAYSNMPATLSLVVVWFLIGLWHGANLPYILWGLMNGLCLILGIWFRSTIDKVINKLHVNINSKIYKTICCIKTFILVAFMEFFSDAGSVSNANIMIKQIFTNFRLPKSIAEILPNIGVQGVVSYVGGLIAILGLVIVFVFSIFQEKGISIRCKFSKVPMLLRIFCLSLLVIIILSFGIQSSWGAGAFLYANF